MTVQTGNTAANFTASLKALAATWLLRMLFRSTVFAADVRCTTSFGSSDGAPYTMMRTESPRRMWRDVRQYTVPMGETTKSTVPADTALLISGFVAGHGETASSAVVGLWRTQVEYPSALKTRIEAWRSSTRPP